MSSSENLVKERYRILEQVGTGGYGAVYQAFDVWKRRVVALKQINLAGLRSHEVIEATDTFNREVQILSDLSHPHLPTIYEHFTDPEHWYLVMDFIEGRTLETILDAAEKTENRAFSLDEALSIGLQLCDVLHYLHTHEPPVIFRDLKPGNIMWTSARRAYLIDFGAARYYKPGKSRDTIAFGSPGYAAPEQYGRAQTTPRSDIYSLGATLHHLLTGHDPSENPFRFASLLSCLPGLLMSPCGPVLQTLLRRMVAMDAVDRPASIKAVKQELLYVVGYL